MTPEALGLVLAFLGLLLLPLLPGLRELWWPRDNQPMQLDQDATVNPRGTALALRRALRAVLAAAGTSPPGAPLPEIHAELRLRPGAEAAATLVVLGETEVGDRARLGEVYAQGEARLGAGVRLRLLAADGDVRLGPDCEVEQWLDTEATAWIGPGCRLGRSASAAKGLHLSAGCTFHRLWGLPVTVDAAARADEASPAPATGGAELTIEDTLVWVGHRLTLPAGLHVDRDVVVHGAVRLGVGAVVRGSLKASRQIHLGHGARVEGNVIGRRGIHVAGGARIAGNVFAEGDVFLGPGTQVGQQDGFKSVYATGRVTLAPDVMVFGWVVANGGGQVTP